MNKPKLINIRGFKKSNDNDPFYRYKMEEVLIMQQQTKIIFTNINNICLDLDRSTKLMVSFLKKYFNSNFMYKDETAQTTKIITKQELQKAIYIFIDDYVLCQKCFNPETILTDSKNKTNLTCKACGHISEI